MIPHTYQDLHLPLPPYLADAASVPLAYKPPEPAGMAADHTSAFVGKALVEHPLEDTALVGPAYTHPALEGKALADLGNMDRNMD